MRFLLLDTQLLVLLLVGLTDKSLIGRHKRLKAYSEPDFELLKSTIARVSSLVVTPNTLTEVSNLIRQVPEPHSTKISETMREFVLATEERHVESNQAVRMEHFAKLGLTDAVVINICENSVPLLTADLDLYLSALRSGIEAVNFNHLREAAGTA